MKIISERAIFLTFVCKTFILYYSILFLWGKFMLAPPSTPCLLIQAKSLPVTYRKKKD
jgi:hypothetical protein